MEVLFLVGTVVLFLLVAPLLAIGAFVRGSRLDREVKDLKQTLDALERRVEALGRGVAAGRLADAHGETAQDGPPRVHQARPADPGSGASPTLPVEPNAGLDEPAAPTPGRGAPLQPAEALTTPPAALPTAAVPDERPSPVEPLVERAPEKVARTAVPARRAARPPASDGPAEPPGAKGRHPSPPPAGPGFDWESLVGLKGAAWLGGITLVIAALLLAKLAYDTGVFTPPLRIAALIAGGVGCLVWAELRLRGGFQTTANAVSGAGVAILYVAFFAAHSLYHLFPLGLTFALMVLVTTTAGLLAIRYDAYFTAVLGLLGGFATPIVVSTGQDRPVGLFSYILLLNVGLISVALKKRWHGLVQLTLAGTLAVELGWFGRFMAPEKMLVGVVAFVLFGLLYLLLPLLARQDADSPALLRTGALGGIAPFLFAVLIAGDRSYSAEWPLLFLLVALLDCALIAVALLRGRVSLLVAGSLATAVTLPLWAAHGLSAGNMWGASCAVIGLALLLNAPSRLAVRFAPERLDEHPGTLEAGGLMAASGLGLFTLVLLARNLGEPPWLFVLLIATLTCLLIERGRSGRLPGVMTAGSLAIGLLILAWFFGHTTGDTLLRNLGVPLLFAVALSVVASHRASANAPAWDVEGGSVAATAMVFVILFGCLASSKLGRDPAPLFVALAVATLLVVASAVRSDWTPLLPASLVASAVFFAVWQQGYFHRADASVALPFYTVFYVVFLALPFVMPARTSHRWRLRAWPWLTSALAGPAYFLVLHDAFVSTWGKAWIGVLPLTLSAFSVAALRGVARALTVRPSSADAAARSRLRYLALFSAVALGFVAVAIPLQLDRQWITIGWALEALAVWWLFARLPHPGLKYFGLLLYAAVGVRLLLNPEVLSYQARGLPILNWLLYTYGVPALCCFLGARFLHAAESGRGSVPQHDFAPGDRKYLVPGSSLLGLLLVFWLINLEVADFFSVGRFVEVNLERQLARDLILSVAWATYAMGLLVLGIQRGVKPLRVVSLGFVVLTVGKVFLYDLSHLAGVYRIVSFLGLGAALIAVSLLYQRFVARGEGHE